MPIYIYRCDKCKGIEEKVQLNSNGDAPACCGIPMNKLPAPIAMVRIKGQGYPSRKKWMDRFNPAQPTGFSTGSLHGEHY